MSGSLINLASSYYIYAEDLVQTPEAPHCFNLWEFICALLLDSEGSVLLVSSILSGSYNFYPHLLWDSLSLEMKNLMEASNVELCVPRTLTLCVISGCGSLHLFLSAAGGTSLMMAE